MSLTRRQFLETAGALVVFAAAPVAGQSPLPRSLRANPDLDTWLRIDRNGIVNVFSGKCELGQGIKTALAQIVADELDVDIGRIAMQTVDTAHSPNEGRTVGSNSVSDSGSALRLAAAEAREILLENAARTLGAPVGSLSVVDGEISGGGSSTSYWELLSTESFDVRLSGNATPKERNQYRYVGTALPRVDLPAKFLGERAFIHDMVLPDLLHARVVRGGPAATSLVDFDDAAALALPGVVSIVHDGDFLAVVAAREEQAENAAELLQRSARWRRTELADSQDLASLLRDLPTSDAVIADANGDSSPGVREFSANYSRPFLAHASMGPSAALARWDGSTLNVWSHAQGMYPLRDAIATITGLPSGRIRCIHADGPGCYGHNGADDVACDAALIALAVEGRPIRVVWSRRDEFINEPYGSAMSIHTAARVDANGRIVDWRHDLWSCSHSTRPAGGASAGGVLAAREKANGPPLPPVSDIGQPNGGADRNSIPLYSIPNQRIVEHLVLEPPLRTSALRSLGAHANVFAIESFIDEIARSLGADPVEFRLRHLDDERGRAVISAASEMASRSGKVEAGTGRGLGFSRYKNSSTYLAVVADVLVEESGNIRLRHVYAAVDAGQVVNPDGLSNQIEGGIVQTASWTLKEQVRCTREGIVTADWASYPILRFEEVPEIDVTVLDRPELPFVGAGEAAQGPTSAAIANAVADATGVRLRHLPLRLPSSA